MGKYRVWCEDCDLERIYDDENPPDHVIEPWDAHDAAMGKRDGHRASEFVDYEAGIRHSPQMEEITGERE